VIDPQTIERINDAAKIEEVVSDYVTLRRRGANLIGLCPFHNEKTPSFNVNPARNIFKCFGCGKGGDSTHFIMEVEQLSYPDALRFLAKKYHIEIQERELTAEEKAEQSDRESMLLVNEFANKHFINNLHHHADGKSIGLSYFRERGFRDDIIQKFQLGYSLDVWDDLAQNAQKAGYNKDYLLKTGLCFENDKDSLLDRFRGRVMFPVHSLSGKVVAFGGRILKKDDKAAKYVNSPESEIYKKSNELYGIYFAKSAINKADRCYLVEGYTDVISMHQNGIENVVASSGTSLTEGQIRLIHRFTDNITVIYDGDAAGIKASIRGIDMLLQEGLNIKVLLLPNGDDPDSFAKKTNASDFVEFVERNSTDFIRFKTNLLLEDAGKDPLKKSVAVRDISQSIATIPDAAARRDRIKEFSELINTDEQALTSNILEIRKKIQEKQYLAKQKENQSLSQKQEEATAQKEQPIDNIKIFEKQSVLEAQEKNILKALFRYGSYLMFEESENSTSVADFIIEELENDAIAFRTELYTQILDEYKFSYKNDDFSVKRYFISHKNAAISALATDLVEDKYVLSKIFKKKEKKGAEESQFALSKKKSEKEKEQTQLIELVSRLVLEYKNGIFIERIRQKIIELKHFSEQKDDENAALTMREISNLEQTKKNLAKTLGERVLIKL
jgi:DNA primase